MKRFIDTIVSNLQEFNNPLDGVSSIPLTKEVPQTDTVTTTKFTHIAQQKERLKNELESGIDTVRNHIENNNFKLARLALENLEKIEEEIRALELEEAGVKDKSANETKGE